jgi:hypothetical protein
MGVVVVARWRRGAWNVVVEGSGAEGSGAEFTARSAEAIAPMARVRAAGSALDGRPPEGSAVVVRFEFPAEVAVHLARAAEHRAALLHGQADRELAAAARKLRSKRMTFADIGVCLGVTAEFAFELARIGPR